MKKLLLLSAVLFCFVGCIFAMNIETGKEFSADRDQKTGKFLTNVAKEIPGVSTGRRTKAWISMANEKTQELFKWVIDRENVRMKITQEGMRKLQEKRAQHIKTVVDEIKMYLDNAVKQANLEK